MEVGLLFQAELVDGCAHAVWCACARARPPTCLQARSRTRERARQANGRAIAFDRSQKTLPYPFDCAPTSGACDGFYIVGPRFSNRRSSIRPHLDLGPIVEASGGCYSRGGSLQLGEGTILNRISTTLAAAALVVAVLGITPLGHAAADAVRVALFAQNAGKVGNIKASRTPVPGQLLALDAKGRFPASVLPKQLAQPEHVESAASAPARRALRASPARLGRRALESRTSARSSSALIQPTSPRTACCSATPSRASQTTARPAPTSSRSSPPSTTWAPSRSP